VHGEIPEKSRARQPTGSAPDTAAPLIYARARTPPPGAGGGGAPKARVGWGMPKECAGIPAKARAGWRRPKKCLGILCRRRVRGGGAGRVRVFFYEGASGVRVAAYGGVCGATGAERMDIPLRSPGGIGVAGAERMINPPAKVLARRRTGLCRTPPAGIYLNPVQKVHYYWLQIISCNG